MIGIMSDSHDNVPMIKRAVSLFRDAGCDLVIHAGDFVAPFSAKELESLNCPVKAVFGNCDGEKIGLERAFAGFGQIGEAPLVFEHMGINFLVSHVHTSLNTYLKGKTYDVIIFGHTHKPRVKSVRQTLQINPGEAGGWLSGKSTVVLLDPKTREAEIIVL